MEYRTTDYFLIIRLYFITIFINIVDGFLKAIDGSQENLFFNNILNIFLIYLQTNVLLNYFFYLICVSSFQNVFEDVDLVIKKAAF